MFVRCFVNTSFRYLQKTDWDRQLLHRFTTTLEQKIISSKCEDIPLSLQIHLSDVYYEEFAKVIANNAPEDVKLKVLDPYCKLFVETKETSLRDNIMHKVFYLIIKISNVGLPSLDKDDEDIESDVEESKNGSENEVDETNEEKKRQ